MEIKSATIGNGSVAFKKAVDPKPETKSTTANVTIVNSAQPGHPAHFEVTFMIEASFEAGGLETRNIFHWSVAVPEGNHFAPYRSVEDRAARLVAPMLRSVADKIEADLPDFADRSQPDAPSPEKPSEG